MAKYLKTIPHSAELMKKKFKYDAATGKLYNRAYRGPTAPEDKESGTLTRAGYRQIIVDGESYQVHRIIWLMMTGKDAPYALWHINRLLDDNRIENLCLMLPEEGPRQGGSDVMLGVAWDEPKKRWQASILIGYTELFLGYFPNYCGALSARRIAETSVELASAQFTEIKS